jgi:cytoskeletal protein RodZ
MPKQKQFNFYEKEKPSLMPFIVAVRILIAGVLFLMAFFAYRYITSEEPPPTRTIPTIAEITEQETPEPEITAEPEITTTTPPISMTRATTTPPQIN